MTAGHIHLVSSTEHKHSFVFNVHEYHYSVCFSPFSFTCNSDS